MFGFGIVAMFLGLIGLFTAIKLSLLGQGIIAFLILLYLRSDKSRYSGFDGILPILLVISFTIGAICGDLYVFMFYYIPLHPNFAMDAITWLFDPNWLIK